MCHPTPARAALPVALPKDCPAKALDPAQRLTLGLQALAGNHTITDLADDAAVSRKFVYHQAATARAALDGAFAPPTPPAEPVLFHLPVTKAWLRQVALGLTLICHSSYRGVVEFCRDLLGVSLSVGTVHNVVRDAVAPAQAANRRQDLAPVVVAGLDEIFHNRRPVLVGADVASTYCFLLSREEHRDADTWGVRLLELQERGLAPRATVADFAPALRAGQKLALPGVPCRGDVFHALRDLRAVVTALENRACEAIAVHDRLVQQHRQVCARARRDQAGQRQALSRRAYLAGLAQAQAVALADDVALLARWLRDDVFAVSALPAADRGALFDFLLAELRGRAPQCPHRLEPVCTLLRNHRGPLLAFADQLEQDLAELARAFRVPLDVVREMLAVQALDERRPPRWQRVAALRRRLRRDYARLEQAVQKVAAGVVRASSVIENLNSRLRGYFFLRRHLGADYLGLLQFFLNHRRFLRSERAARVDKSPAELLTGQGHPHWLEMLGYQRFSRN